MSLSKKPYKGTRDFFPTDKRIHNYICNAMIQTAELFGYEPYDGPLLEEVELYRAKSGEELINEQIYSFHDRGNRFIAIRPEMTPTLARMVAQIHRQQTRPIRWYSIPNLMRYENPQKGRLREHWQFNCDIFGAPDLQGEIEILQIAVNLLTHLGASSEHFEILVNNRAIVDTTFKTLMRLNDETTYRLYKIVDKIKKVDEAAIDKMLGELMLTETQKYLFYDYIALKDFHSTIEFLKRHRQPELAHAFSEFVEQLNNVNLLSYLRYDPAIVRGLDYYTGTVFEIYDKHPENNRAICGGGTYANLLQIFDEPSLAGVGFGLGDVTLRAFLELHQLLPNFELPKNNLFFAYQDERCKNAILKLAGKLRENGISVVTHFGAIKFKKIFPLAEKRGASFAGFMGEDELLNQTVQIKNLNTKQQIAFSINEITKISELITSEVQNK